MLLLKSGKIFDPISDKLKKSDVLIKKNKIEPPALIVVGEVVSLRSYMKWMD